MKIICRTAAAAGAAGILLGATVTAASASTGTKVIYYATAGHQFGPPVTGNAVQAIETLAGRYRHDPAELAVTAGYDGYKLPGGARWLIAHPQQWASLASGFGSYLLAHVVEEVQVTRPYRTMYAVRHPGGPTTFGWEAMPAHPSDVLVFSGPHGEFYLRMNCGGQIMTFARPVPLPARPHTVTCRNGGHGRTCTAPCPSGETLFHVPGVGGMCLCPKAKLITVSVVVQTTYTVTETQTWGECSSSCPGKN